MKGGYEVGNNKKSPILIIIFVIFIIVIYLNINMINDLRNLKGFLSNSDSGRTSSLKIALIYSDEKDFGKLLTRGAKKSSRKENVDLRIFSLNPADRFKLTDYFKLSMLAEYEGIIIDGETPALIPLIKRAYQNNIPVVTILSDLPSSARISYVGMSNYRTGFIIGKRMIDNFSDSQSLKLAIISTDYGQKELTPTAEYLKIFGFREAVSSNSNTEITSWKKTEAEMLKALQTVSRLINNNPCIDGIFATHPVATLAAANFIKRYKKEDIILIGYGNSKEIKEYIKKGVIDASVINNPQQVGYNAVKEISTYIKEKKVNLHSSIEIELLTPDNLKENLLR